MHALSGMQNQGLSIQEIKAYASDRVATGTIMKVVVVIIMMMINM
jgi:hypothetical protein